MIFCWFEDGRTLKSCYDFIKSEITNYKNYEGKVSHYNDKTDPKSDGGIFDWDKEPARSAIKTIGKRHIGYDSDHVKSFGGTPVWFKEYTYMQGGEEFFVPAKNGFPDWDIPLSLCNCIKEFYPRNSSIVSKFELLAKNRF